MIMPVIAVKSPECPSEFNIYQKVLEIGKTIIKSVVMADGDKVLSETFVGTLAAAGYTMYKKYNGKPKKRRRKVDNK